MFLDHTQRRSTVISSSQRPLPDNTRHSQQTNIHAPGGIRTRDLSRWAACGRGHGCLFVVSVVCCQVEVSAMNWSLVQRSPTDCGASLCDLENSRMRRPWPALGRSATAKKKKSCCGVYHNWKVESFALNFERTDSVLHLPAPYPTHQYVVFGIGNFF